MGLPRPPGALGRFWKTHPWLFDGLLAAGYLIVSVFWSLVTPLSSGVWSPAWPYVVPLVVSVVTSASLVFRSHRPWLTFAVFGAGAVVALVTDTVVETFGVGLAVYALFVYRSNRSGWIAFGITVGGGVLVLPALDWLREPDPERLFASVPTSVLFLAVMLIAALLGVNVGDRRRYIGAILDRANQLARERDQQARIATLAERARITREIHDVVAHSVSVMVSLADGADALAEKDPKRSRDAVQEIGEIGRQSLVEMRSCSVPWATTPSRAKRTVRCDRIRDLPSSCLSSRPSARPGSPCRCARRGARPRHPLCRTRSTASCRRRSRTRCATRRIRVRCGCCSTSATTSS